MANNYYFSYSIKDLKLSIGIYFDPEEIEVNIVFLIFIFLSEMLKMENFDNYRLLSKVRSFKTKFIFVV